MDGFLSLDQVGVAFGTDKSSLCHNYLHKYERYFHFPRDACLNILEIGVFDGASLRMWASYYPNARIIGVDINENCKQYQEGRVSVEIGSQVDSDFLARIVKDYGNFDLIIDDGSHHNSHMIFSFCHLFPFIKKGGHYVVEDVSTSYWEPYGGGFEKEGSVIEFFKKLVHDVNFYGEYAEDCDSIYCRKDDILLRQFEKKGKRNIFNDIESINFMNSIIMVTKRLD